MEETITYIGLDVHKETVPVALADGGGRGDVRAFGQIVNTPRALARMLAKLSQPGLTFKFCYEAGPCGYGIQRQLSAAGRDCVVVAPSLIHKKSGDRIKTDRRDASNLARLHRAMKNHLMAFCGMPGAAQASSSRKRLRWHWRSSIRFQRYSQQNVPMQ